MIKEIKDYLHLYFGCEVVLVNDISENYENDSYEDPAIGSVGKLALVNSNFQINCQEESEDWPYGIWFDKCYICFWDAKDFKLLLRPLSDILNTEAFEVYKMYFGKETALDFSNDTGSANFNPKRVRVLAEHAIKIFNGEDYETGDFMKVISIVPYLLSKHFDLFGLIEAGLAIDKTTLIKP